MPFERDPLSARYDAATGTLIGRALARPGQWVYTAIPRPGRGAVAANWLRAHHIQLDHVDAGGLTAYQRAYQRALYWNAKQMGISTPAADNPRWSLQREWGPDTTHGRMLGIRLSKPDVARRAVARKPASQQWWRRAGLRSGGQGSARQRFG